MRPLPRLAIALVVFVVTALAARVAFGQEPPRFTVVNRVNESVSPVAPAPLDARRVVEGRVQDVTFLPSAAYRATRVRLLVPATEYDAGERLFTIDHIPTLTADGASVTAAQLFALLSRGADAGSEWYARFTVDTNTYLEATRGDFTRRPSRGAGAVSAPAVSAVDPRVLPTVPSAVTYTYTTRPPVGHTHTDARGHTLDHRDSQSHTCTIPVQGADGLYRPCGLSQFQVDPYPRPVTVAVPHYTTGIGAPVSYPAAAPPVYSAPVASYAADPFTAGGCANGQCGAPESGTRRGVFGGRGILGLRR